MSKLASRLLVFFVGIPVVLLIIAAPICNHILLHILVCIISALGASELYNMFSHEHRLLPKPYIIVCSILIPLSVALHALFASIGIRSYGISEIVTFTYILLILISFGIEVFTENDFTASGIKVALSVFIFTYTGLLLTFTTRMTECSLDGKDIAFPLISVFALMVFMCDSFAWAFGMLFGKGNRGIVKASPNKSLAGFFGGFVGSICSGLLGYALWPYIFSGAILKIIFVGICVAFSSILGDITESIFKRSADVKDSGSIIPGRGGVLDSIDSMLMSAPVYYYLISLLFGPF